MTASLDDIGIAVAVITLCPGDSCPASVMIVVLVYLSATVTTAVAIMPDSMPGTEAVVTPMVAWIRVGTMQ